MRVSRIAVVLGSLALLGAAPAGAPRRIVSLNLCADQLVVELADPDQIVAVTEWARDPQLSAVAGRARHLPVSYRTAEEVIALHPDLVIGAPYRTKAALAPLTARGLRMIDMPYANDVPGIETAITAIAAAVGHPERGVRTIARMRRDLGAVGPPPGRGRIAAYYQRQGYLTGTGTLVDDMIRRAGLRNLAARLGRSPLSRLSLEDLALARPDFLILEADSRSVADRGTAALHHPVLDKAVPLRRRLYISQAFTVCGGPSYPRAVALLVAQIRAADRVR